MPQIVTAIDAVVAADRESDLLEGFASLNASTKPDGLVRSELLRGQDGAWRIQTTWRDRDAVIALRQSGEPPAALRLLESIGATHTHAVFTVEQRHGE
jgi:heme-degrading monooxygenase HmoA